MFGLFLVFVACEKDWTCRCDTTGGEIAILIKDATEEEAEKICSERSERKLQGHHVSDCEFEGEFK